jgi:nickel-dependent lactate racemase
MKIPYGSGVVDLAVEAVLGPPQFAWSAAEAGRPRTAGPDRFAPPAWDRLLERLPGDPARPVLVVADGTRRGLWQAAFAGLAADLRNRWPKTRLDVLVATGIHAPVPEKRLCAHLGLTPEAGHASQEASRLLDDLRGGRLALHQHDAGGDLTNLGSTARGTAVSVDDRYAVSDARILLGGTSYHYFAGFGGGPKLVFPGLAGRAGILHNHLLAVDETTGRWRSRCAGGRLAGNPVAEDIAEAASLAPPHALVLVERAGRTGEPAVNVGWADWLDVFGGACRRYDREHRIPLDRPLDGVVADAGGEPRDLHLLQVHKSLQHAVRFVGPGGWILLAGACRDGVGSPSLIDLASRTFRESALEIRRTARASFHLQTAVALRHATRGREVGLLSGLSARSPDAIRSLGWTPLAGEAAALAWLEGRRGARWAWLSEADTVLPVLPARR